MKASVKLSLSVGVLEWLDSRAAQTGKPRGYLVELALNHSKALIDGIQSLPVDPGARLLHNLGIALPQGTEPANANNTTER